MLGQGIDTLFERSADWEDGGLVSQRTILPELVFRFLLHPKERKSGCLLQTLRCRIVCSCSCQCKSGHDVSINPQQDKWCSLFSNSLSLYKQKSRSSLVVQWLGVCLPMQGKHGFYPWSGKMPHAAGWLTLCTATAEASGCNRWGLGLQPLRPRAATTRPSCPRAHALQQEKSRNEKLRTPRELPPLSKTRESRCTAVKTQHNQKLKTKWNFKWKSIIPLKIRDLRMSYPSYSGCRQHS